MRIALDATYSVDKHPSGIAVYSREILNGLANRHSENSYVHYYRPKQYRHAPASKIRKRRLFPFLGGLQLADVYHALNQRCDRRMGRRVVTTFHDLFVLTNEYSSRDFRQRFAEQARVAAQNSDRIIAVSQFTANQVHELLKVERSRITVVPHGVHLTPGLDRQEEKLILTVGAVQLRKNTARLVEAFEALPNDWRLVIAGAASGYGAESILQRIENSPAKERIQIAGYVSSEELNRLYSRAAIFAFTSLDEGFGIPVLEAMAHGVPVVTSNRSALPEVAGDAALLVDPTDVSAIAGALAKLIADPTLRSELAVAGLKRAALFPWNRAVDETHKVYVRLMGSDG